MVLILCSQCGVFRCGCVVESGKVDAADSANHVVGKVVPLPFQFKDTDMLVGTVWISSLSHMHSLLSTPLENEV